MMDILAMTRNRCPAEGLFGEVPRFMLEGKHDLGKLPETSDFEDDFASYAKRLIKKAKEPASSGE